MSKFKGKRALVVGFGKTGISVARYLVKQGAKVTVTDTRQKSELTDAVNFCAELKLEYDLGNHSDRVFEAAEMVVVSPGVPPSLPQLTNPRDRKIPITGEIELAASAIKEPIITVTGSNGKTTVTTLIGEMFKADQKSAFVGGNIGKPLLDYVTDGHKADYVVAELSSFQLDQTTRLVPAVAVFTNIEENHLDRYPSMEVYVESKKRLLRACDRNSYVVLNYDNALTRQFAIENVAKLMWFTNQNPMLLGGEFAEQFRGVYCDAPAKRMVAKITGREEVYDISQFRLLGGHNRENLMAAICAARAMGVSQKAIQTVINDFKGVPHRLEFVRRKDGVYFFNDSKSTNAMSMMRSLQAFQHSPVILIAGGRDKNTEFGHLGPLVQKKCKILILLGEAKEKLNRSLGDFAETYLVGTFEEAILLAYQKSRSGDIILLSPGCASYDMFRNFEERGDYFKRLVNQL